MDFELYSWQKALTHILLLRVRLFIHKPRLCHTSCHSYELLILPWLVGVILFRITLFCVTFTSVSACLCCLHADFLPAAMLCKRTQAVTKWWKILPLRIEPVVLVYIVILHSPTKYKSVFKETFFPWPFYSLVSVLSILCRQTNFLFT